MPVQCCAGGAKLQCHGGTQPVTAAAHGRDGPADSDCEAESPPGDKPGIMIAVSHHDGHRDPQPAAGPRTAGLRTAPAGPDGSVNCSAGVRDPSPWHRRSRDGHRAVTVRADRHWRSDYWYGPAVRQRVTSHARRPAYGGPRTAAAGALSGPRSGHWH
jgi:hypothetical protein